MRRFLLFIFMLLSINAFAQYKTVYPDRITFYKSKSVYSASVLGNAGEYVSLKIEGTSLKGGDTLYFNYRVFGKSDSEQSCGTWSSRAYPWTGRDIIMLKDQREVFINNEKDSVIFQKFADINDSWIFYSKGDTYFEATVIKKEVENVVIHDTGMSDSVITISIYLKKKSDNSIVPHAFNGKQWKISKSLGFVKTYSLLSFPQDTNSLTIAGVDIFNLGVSNLTEKEIYDFEVGDEFHIREFNFGNGNNKKIKQSVLEKYLNAGNDSVIYKISIVENVEDYFREGAQLLVQLDTIYLKIPLYPELKGINEVPRKASVWIGDTGDPFLYNYQYMQAESPSVMVKSSESLIYFHAENDSCFSPSLSNYSYYEKNYEYWKGLGGPYYDKRVGTVMYPMGRELVYYKKDSGEWGTPMELVMGTYPNKINVSISLSPNPASDKLSISSGGIQNTYYKVYNNEGREVLYGNFASTEEIIDINGLRTGIYSVMILKEGGVIYSSRFVKN